MFQVTQRAFPNSSKEGKLTQDEASSLGLEVSS